MNYFLIILTLFSTYFISAQKLYRANVVMFYNVENLFDTIRSSDVINGNLSPNDPNYIVSISEDSAKLSGLEEYKGELTFEKLNGKHVIRRIFNNDEFTPKGNSYWNTKAYKQKIKNISKVILDIGSKAANVSPAIIGLSEIENEHVLRDLCKSLNDKSTANYTFAHFNSFDPRGIDVAMLYNEKIFEKTSQKRFTVDLHNKERRREYTRDILLVNGILDGEEFYFIVSHWPSKRGGAKISNPKREAVAKKLKSIIENIITEKPNAKIISMGDFNEDSNSKYIKTILNTVSTREEAIKDKNVLFNPSEYAFKKSASTAYRDNYNFIDQFVLTPSLINSSGYKYLRMSVFSPNYLKTQEGPYKGYPFRSFNGGSYTGGYSDHYPIYLLLVKEAEDKK